MGSRKKAQPGPPRRDAVERAAAEARRNKLVMDWHDFIVARATLHSRSAPPEDAIQEAMLDALKAAEKFDAGIASSFSTLLAHYVRRAAWNADRRAWHIPVPAYVESAMVRYSYARTEAARVIGREPTFEEVADRIDFAALAAQASPTLTAESLRAALAAAVAIRGATWRRMADNLLGERGASRVQETVDSEWHPAVDDSPSPPEVASRAEESAGIRDALAVLDPREREAVTLRFGLDGGGERSEGRVAITLRVCPDRARQIIADALEKLRPELARRNIGVEL